MSEARSQILGAIRRARGRGALGEGERAALEEHLARHPRGTVPARSVGAPAALVERFVAMAEAVAATVARVETAAEVPGAVADYLKRHNLPPRVRVAPDAATAGLDWSRAPTLEVTTGPSDGSDEVGVAPALAAVAETGTLMLASGAGTPTTLNFLPETHVVVVRESQVVGPYEDGWDRLRAAGALPRTVNFITGPSRTGDIEQKILMGAHGPRRLHVVLVRD